MTSYNLTSKDVSLGHGDLNLHEFGISENGSPFHELSFVDGSTIYIEFNEFNYREQHSR